ELREELSERVRRGQLFGFLEIGPDVIRGAPPGAKDPDQLERAQVRYQSNRPTHQEFPHIVQQALASPIQEARARREGVSPAKAARISRPVPVVSKGLSVRTAEGKVQDAGEQSRFAPLAVPMALMILMFMMVLMSATPLMQGVVEEKMQRIAEVLLGSVQPFQLMLGKLIGMTGVSLTMACVYLGGAHGGAHHFGFAEHVHWSLLVWFFVFQTLASLMYGSLFIAVGAACTDMKETQTLLWPVMLLAMIPMFMMGNVLQEPNSGVVTAASFFPFATPMLMIARQGVPPGVPWWQPALGTLVVLLTTLACVWAAGRIFRVGLLLQGKGANLAEMARWVLRG